MEDELGGVFNPYGSDDKFMQDVNRKSLSEDIR
jgi:hypothetical protein